MSGPRSDVQLSEAQRERIWKVTYFHLRRKGWSQHDAMGEATKRLDVVYPPPPKPKRVGGVKGLLLRFAVSRVFRNVSEVRMSPLVKKIVTSLVFGIGAIGLGLQAALADGVISSGEWPALVSAFVAAFWGKFSSNTTILAPSRKGETVDGPGA